MIRGFYLYPFFSRLTPSSRLTTEQDSFSLYLPYQRVFLNKGIRAKWNRLYATIDILSYFGQTNPFIKAIIS